MKIKQISCDTVSVYLTKEDMELFDISLEELGPHSGELNNFLFMLMETVRFETEFDPYNGQVVVEAHTTVEGLHLLISKLNKNIHKITREEFARARRIRVIKNLAPLDIGKYQSRAGGYLKNIKSKRKNKKGVFIFECFKDLENGIALVEEDVIKKSELYRFGKRYALISDVIRNERAYSILNEFATIYKMSDVLANDIREGWKPVAKCEKLSEMVSELRKMQ